MTSGNKNLRLICRAKIKNLLGCTNFIILILTGIEFAGLLHRMIFRYQNKRTFKLEAMKISVVIQTYNSEQFLERVLNSVKEFDEIVVCDMYSTDRTIEIARKFDCKIVYHKKTDFCEPARNFAIHSATYDWVLVVDSDEIVPADLKDYLYTLLREQRAIGGVWIPRKNYLMGKIHTWGLSGLYLTFFP